MKSARRQPFPGGHRTHRRSRDTRARVPSRCPPSARPCVVPRRARAAGRRRRLGAASPQPQCVLSRVVPSAPGRVPSRPEHSARNARLRGRRWGAMPLKGADGFAEPRTHHNHPCRGRPGRKRAAGEPRHPTAPSPDKPMATRSPVPPHDRGRSVDRGTAPTAIHAQMHAFGGVTSEKPCHTHPLRAIVEPGCGRHPATRLWLEGAEHERENDSEVASLSDSDRASRGVEQPAGV